MDHQPAPADSGVRTELFALSDALTKVIGRLRTHADAARGFGQLTNRAETIAADARRLQTSRWNFAENAGKLATSLVAFAEDTAAASVRAIAEAEENISLIKGLTVQAERLKELGAGKDGQPHTIQALRPLQSTLVSLQARMATASIASKDAATLAKRAEDLAICALSLGGKTSEATEAAATINRALRSFAEAATSVAARLTSSPDVWPTGVAGQALKAIENELSSYHQASRSGPVAASVEWR